MKKLFALASVSALAGFLSAVGAAGCSSATRNNSLGDAGTDANEGGRRIVDPPLARDDDAGGDDDYSCVDATPIDATKYPYKSPGITANACTTKELSDLSDAFKKSVDNNTDVVVSEWAKVVSASCAVCVFSDGTGATWTPILTKGDKLDEVNRGGCIEIQSGKEACGKAYQQMVDCRIGACLSKCKTQDAFNACLQDATIFDGPCKDAVGAVQKDCGANLGAYEDACKGTAWTFEGPIKAQCVTGVDAKGDAGDGGT